MHVRLLGKTSQLRSEEWLVAAHKEKLPTIPNYRLIRENLSQIQASNSFLGIYRFPADTMNFGTIFLSLRCQTSLSGCASVQKSCVQESPRVFQAPLPILRSPFPLPESQNDIFHLVHKNYSESIHTILSRSGLRSNFAVIDLYRLMLSCWFQSTAEKMRVAIV